MTKEIWKKIPLEPWGDHYEVSNLGRVRHAPNIIPQYEADGYCRVPLASRGSKSSVPVHRLVAAAFIRLPKADEMVNHINCQRNDNRPENLEWTTMLKNLEHAKKNLRHVPSAIRKLLPELVFLKHKEGQTITEIAKDFSVDVACVGQMMKRYKMQDKGMTIEKVMNKRSASTTRKNIDFNTAKKMRESGLTLAEIGKKFNATGEAIGSMFRKNNFYFINDRVKQKTKSDIIRMRKSGKTINEIINSVQSSNRTVRKILDNVGIK